MSRRRRLSSLPTGDDEDDHSSDWMSEFRTPPARELSSRSQLRQFKKKPTIHPALTNYGPESLQCFLRDELEKLKNDALDIQRKQVAELARSLVDYSGDLRIVHDSSTRSFSIARLPTYPGFDETTDKGKGKASLRKGVRQKSLGDIQQDNGPREDKTSGARGALQTTIHRTTRSSNRLDALIGPTETRAIDIPPASYLAYSPSLSAAHPPAFGGRPREPSESPLLNLNLDHSPRTNRRSLRFNGPQKSPTRKDALCRQSHSAENEVDETFDTLNDLNLYSDTGSINIGNTARNSLRGNSTSHPGRLTRAASFETHAEHTRDFRRTRDKSFSLSDQPPEESRRRRKMPTHSHGRPSSSLPSAFMTQPLQRASQDQAGDLLTDDTEEMEDITINTTVPSHSHQNATSEDLRAIVSLQSTAPRANSGTLVDYDGVRDSIMLELGAERRLRRNLYESDTEDEYDDFEEQQAIFASASQAWNPSSPNTNTPKQPIVYDYNQIVPEELPRNIKKAAANCELIWQAHGHDSQGKPRSTPTTHGPFTTRELDPQEGNILNAPNESGDYKRSHVPSLHSPIHGRPPSCPPPTQPRDSLPHEIWEAGVLEYLSSGEVRALRLVCKSIAEDLEPYVFRSVVVRFGPSFFDVDANNDSRPDATGPGSMLGKFGPGINKFGISFEYDQMGMTNAPFKVTETTVNAWFGNYKWPVKDYPYFPPLKEIDMLLDDQPRLLTQAMKNLQNCHELALSVDSGHGWLEGPDMSDLALYRHRASGGSKVFGKTFSAEDSTYEEGMKQLFEWAQRNTINENIKHHERSLFAARKEVDFLREVVVRPYDDYRIQDKQPDFEKDLHTGKEFVAPAAQANNAGGGMANNGHQLMFTNNQAMFVPPATAGVPNRRRRPRFDDVLRIMSSRPVPQRHQNSKSGKTRTPIQPQWPLVFNGYNVSADVSGDSSCIQERVSNPSEYPLLPGSLNEAQAQWLMETSWIQRTFLSSYTDAIRTNAAVFKKVHSLHISKISSGLLSSLSQKTFWSSLPELRKLIIFVQPDWRVEHIPGDKFYQTTMSTKLIEAAVKFADLLRDSIGRIETLNNLHVGYCAGGEHQKGIFGRNQHVLPAPIVSNPRDWLLAQNPANTKPEENAMITFPHVRNLTFENCWFSPLMLETFMHKSHDSSLHDLILDSVSLTAQVNSTRTDGPLRTYENQLKCMHPSGAWLQETLPANASWVNLLDKITPGRTIQDQKYDAGMVNEEEVPRPEAQFRGNIQQITLNSCGYVKVQNIAATEFNQNELVFHSTEWNSLDDGLKLRANKFTKTTHDDDLSKYGTEYIIAASENRHHPLYDRARIVRAHDLEENQKVSTHFIMQGGQTAQDVLFGLTNTMTSGLHMTGSLTQCIHPIEKRILEQNWGMRFGWGNDMRRWESVEDGWFIGGTGRFSGKIFKDQKKQERENNTRLQELAKAEAKRKDETHNKGAGKAPQSSRVSRNLWSSIYGAAPGPSASRPMTAEEAFDLDDEQEEDEDDLGVSGDEPYGDDDDEDDSRPPLFDPVMPFT